MKLQMSVAGEAVCVIEVWEDKVPNLAKELRAKLPMTSILQHGKLIGDMVFFTMPIVAPWENKFKTEEVGRMRREKYGVCTGSVCFYSPRQQFCVVYGDDTAEEPLPISYIGEVIEGSLQLRVTGLETWFDQGRTVELAVIE
ncbi:hypothetical protein [Rouxiella badensis]|jgi:hypothetical protein|uniref:DUF3830 domain-containing protein n=1 Tax=Rouxiella badensis TaxID=1646377 RepID=A0A1X0WGK6_9GAMM|nr:hypothetical protein [Rouxiella badensis]MCC3701577.1 hypothetical protein [Rouxiella badensis]MCC3719406.1 hypothetical protein [Rouxiella badensis]MCC3728656.1 hypothetical protein [Rouxiella badensis]MCC3734311.1 hypothetical protein [Rouxiella badensis]MCC3739348.1 hypothetical protein [Rouxiella badensis]